MHTKKLKLKITASVIEGYCVHTYYQKVKLRSAFDRQQWPKIASEQTYEALKVQKFPGEPAPRPILDTSTMVWQHWDTWLVVGPCLNWEYCQLLTICANSAVGHLSILSVQMVDSSPSCVAMANTILYHLSILSVFSCLCQAMVAELVVDRNWQLGISVEGLYS